MKLYSGREQITQNHYIVQFKVINFQSQNKIDSKKYFNKNKNKSIFSSIDKNSLKTKQQQKRK